jgi:hypothetical protein
MRVNARRPLSWQGPGRLLPSALPAASLAVRGQAAMSDDPKDVIEFAIRSAFLNYPKEDDPNWKSPHWIEPKECAHLAMTVILELEAKGFQIVKN